MTPDKNQQTDSATRKQHVPTIELQDIIFVWKKYWRIHLLSLTTGALCFGILAYHKNNQIRDYDTFKVHLIVEDNSKIRSTSALESIRIVSEELNASIRSGNSPLNVDSEVESLNDYLIDRVEIGRSSDFFAYVTAYRKDIASVNRFAESFFISTIKSYVSERKLELDKLSQEMFGDYQTFGKTALELAKSARNLEKELVLSTASHLYIQDDNLARPNIIQLSLLASGIPDSDARKPAIVDSSFKSYQRLLSSIHSFEAENKAFDRIKPLLHSEIKLVQTTSIELLGTRKLTSTISKNALIGGFVMLMLSLTFSSLSYMYRVLKYRPKIRPQT